MLVVSVPVADLPVLIVISCNHHLSTVKITAMLGRIVLTSFNFTQTSLFLPIFQLTLLGRQACTLHWSLL